jgi:hypothetical protein
VAELVDALDSKSSSARSAGSIPARGTIQNSSANHSGRRCPLKHILAVFDADLMVVDLDRVDEMSLICFPDWN